MSYMSDAMSPRIRGIDLDNPPELFGLWTSLLSCGCWTSPISPDGHPYGRAREGSWETCTDDCRHQGSYKVLETRRA